MNRVARRVIALILALVWLAGCRYSTQNTFFSSSSFTNNSISVYTQTGSPDAVSHPRSDAQVINEPMLNLIGATNNDLMRLLDAAHDRKCAAYNIGSQTEALSYYDPHIIIYFISRGAASWAPQATEYYMGDLAYSKNPYAEELEIWYIQVRAEYSPNEGVVGRQDNLRQVFNIQEPITYQLLSEKLAQSPALTHILDAQYVPIDNYQPLGHPDIPPQPIAGRVYQALFYHKNAEIVVNFIADDEQYIAYEVSFYAT